MASKRAIRRRACGQKKRYGTHAEAVTGMRWLRARAIGMVTYSCRFCGGYHFGHPPQRVRQAIENRLDSQMRPQHKASPTST